MNEEEDKKVTFYKLCRDQYQKSKGPIVYELDFTSAKPKPRAGKFNIIINKFITIYKSGMKEIYDHEEDTHDNYWNQLLKKFLGKSYRQTQNSRESNMELQNLDNPQFQLKYLSEMCWQKPKIKLRKYMVLLLHRKRLFSTIETIINQMGYLYVDPEGKTKELKRQLSYVDFLKDGGFQIMGELITNFDEYVEEEEERIEVKKKQLEDKIKKQQEEQRLRKIKEEKQRAEQERLEQMMKQDEEKRRKVEEELAARNKQQLADEPVITADYFPQNYQGIHRDFSKKNIPKIQSEKELSLPNKEKAQHKRIKKSQILYIQAFQDEFNTFSYNLEPEVSEEKQVCAMSSCKKNLKSGIYFLGGNQNYCYYTGKWYCNEDISDNRMSIPWKAIKKFDLRGYTVCKTAHAELLSYYQKPLIQITPDNPIIHENQRLYQFLVIKRQIHLIYDSICNIDHIVGILKKKMNYCLKQNLFSMKNLYDIYNGQEMLSLQRDYQILSRHFYRCEICQKRRGYNCPVCKDPVKIFPFQLKETHGCKICRKLYHRNCLPTGNCQCTEQ